MSTTHTPGPWHVANIPDMMGPTAGTYEIFDKPYGLGVVANANSEADAKRIVDCVNACEGIRQPSDFMECLLDTLKNVKQMYEDVQPAGGYQGVYEDVCAAIDDLSRNFKNQTNE